MIKNEPLKKILLILSGALVGIVNGLLGGGGGMLVVPVLIYIMGMNVKNAHATAILIILPISLVSAVIYFFGGKLPFPHSLFGIAGAVIGGIIGAYALKSSGGGLLKALFALLMIVAGIMSAM